MPCNRTRARTAIRCPAISSQLARPGKSSGLQQNTCPRTRTAIRYTTDSSCRHGKSTNSVTHQSRFGRNIIVFPHTNRFRKHTVESIWRKVFFLLLLINGYRLMGSSLLKSRGRILIIIGKKKKKKRNNIYYTRTYITII